MADIEKNKISQKIIDYAIWYYLRYFPSTAKLRNKLTEKFGPQSEKGQRYGGIFPGDIDYIIIEKMGTIIDEPEVIRSHIRGYISKGKNIHYIKSKLYGKLFLKDEYEKILSKEFDSDTKTLLEYQKVLQQALTLKNKNKPANYIRKKFIERALDKQIVEDVISELFPDGEQELLLTELLKIIKAPVNIGDSQEFISDAMQNLDFKHKQKITQKLVGKGFMMGDIIEMMK